MCVNNFNSGLKICKYETSNHFSDSLRYAIRNYKQLKLNKMKYEITEEQIKTIEADGCTYVKEWFPDVFELKLEIGKWYKVPTMGEAIFCITKIIDEEIYAYGFNYKGEWRDNKEFGPYIGNEEPATDSEVLEALTNEAKKRGFKEGVYIKNIYGTSKINNKEFESKGFSFDEQELFLDGFLIFSKGIWATIITTYTKEEAEKMLNAKIV